MQDPEDTGQGPYDPDPVAEQDLWFLPGPAEDDPEGGVLPPLPRADRRLLFDIAAWTAAEAAQAVQLARVAALFGALDERLRAAPEGWRQRLALREVFALSWQVGDRVSVERLALWTVLRLPGPQDDAQALARAAWALRRLAAGPGPQDGVAAFLARQTPVPEQKADDVVGVVEGLAARVTDFEEVMAQAGVLHPVSRGALAQHAWQVLGNAEGLPIGARAREASQEIEAAVVASRIAAAESRGGAPFLPLAFGRPGVVATRSDARVLLAAWLQLAEQGCTAALLHLDQLEAWERRAGQVVAGRSGRTPPLLVRVLRDWPLVSAPMAEAHTGGSRAAVQRNLAWMEEQGLIREVTGQGRYRFWSARLNALPLSVKL